ncbi:hypothetical protein GIB67_033950 [Kingdonia uniflora]|uniref:Uncharacterized protein n=1 Tax=Kingdonia uniflora TaxID=39325 RepID=A0A7J7L6J3_9MAGN|nr:hypothetical protein GIB67_033950 [Kingdonia uniflora]
MDGVELPLRQATIVAVSKLLTVDGFMVGDNGARGGSKRKVAIFGTSSSSEGNNDMDTGVGVRHGYDVTCALATSEQTSTYRSKKVDVGLYPHESSIPNFGGECNSKQIPFRNTNSSDILLQKRTSKQLRRIAENEFKSGSYGSKRQRLQKVECSTSQAVACESNAISVKQESSLMKCTFPERSRGPGSKHALDGKRGERRNSKVPAKNRFDSFFSKVGLASSASTVEGDGVFGVCGLKSDTYDVTKHVDELALNELLDGTYKHPNFLKDNGKKASNTNENLLRTVRKACSLLQQPKSVQPQDAVELESKQSPSSAETMGVNVTSSSKGSSIKSEVPTTSNTPLLLQPKNVLERLRLAAHKDLDTLLLDTSKLALSSRDTLDPGISKMSLRGGSLPPFAWSYCFNGSSKTAVDMGKMSTSRSACQGRWVKVGSIANSLGDLLSCFSDLDSLTYDDKGSSSMRFHHSLEELNLLQKMKFGSNFGFSPLAPEAESKVKHSETDVTSMSTSSTSLHIPESVDNYFDKEQFMKRVNSDRCSPSILAAAQILCDIASCSTMQEEDRGNIRCHNKPSQKTLKTNKAKSSAITGDMPLVPKSATGPRDMVKNTDRTTPTKKPNRFTNNEKGESSYANNVGRSPIKWSIPTSSRSSPSRPENYLVTDRKHSSVDTIKLFGMIPSSKRVLNRVCNGEQKLRKTMVIDWGRGRRKND